MCSVPNCLLHYLTKLFLTTLVHSFIWPWVIVTVWLFLIWPVSSFNLWPFIECFSIISLFFCRYDYFWFINNNLLLGFIIYISFLMLKILNVVVIRWFELLIGSYLSILGNIQEARHKTLKFPRKQNRRISQKVPQRLKRGIFRGISTIVSAELPVEIPRFFIGLLGCLS